MAVSRAGLRNISCDSVARNSVLIAMVSHELPSMQWALVTAKRLECGSLLPLSLYAQTTCLEPDRHGVENKVPVPISASEGCLRTLRRPRIGKRGNLRATPQSGSKPKQRACHPIRHPVPTHSQRPCCCDRITGGQRSRYGGIDRTRRLKIFPNMEDFPI